MSAGIAPPGDVTLHKEDSAGQKPTPRRSLAFRHYNAFAVAAVLSASGMVCPEYFGFVVLSVVYMYFISKIAFPPTSPQPPPPVYSMENKILGPYVLAGAVIGLYSPIAYILEGIVEGDNEGVKAAAPQVFLLASQIFMEGLAFTGGFSLPVRVFVPVLYNSVRILSIWEWVRSEFWKGGESLGGSQWRLLVGKALALANMAFWSFNLFGFLLPFYLPKAFKIYYSHPKIKD